MTAGTAAEPATDAGRTSAAGRVVGIDLARCLAIVGMLVAHVGYVASGDYDDGWVMPFNGRSAALFATLAGVSIAIITRRSDERVLGWRYARFVIAVRGAILLVVGYLLVLLDTPIEIILPAYGVMFLMVLPVLRLPVPALAGLAVAVIVVAPVVVFALQRWWTGGVYPDVEIATYDPLLTGTYPALTWIGYLLAGLVVGRTAIRTLAGAWTLIGVGAVLALLGYGTGHLLAVLTDAWTGEWPGVLLSVEPHADTTFEVTGNLGVAFVVLGLCLLVTRLAVASTLLAPLLAAGSMSLTIYTAQIVVVALLGDDVVQDPTSNAVLVAMAAGSIVGAWAWRSTFGQGPLERAVAWVSKGVAGLSVGPGSGPGGPGGPGAAAAAARDDGGSPPTRSE